MILCDWLIKLFIFLRLIKVEPYNPALINPASLDVTLFSIDKPSQPGYWNLEPDEFILGCLGEKITLPRFIYAELKGKSSIGRLGIDNSSCSGVVDPGFEGILTIEIHNMTKKVIKLKPTMRIGQLIFHLMLPCWTPYGKKKDSKYQNQPPMQGSKYDY